jgi:hypothetical protein
MLTIFTIPKPFKGHIRDIQRNAIRSWLGMEPRPEIILCGDDPGVADTARELGVRHLPTVVRNSYGTPLLNSTFEAVQQTAQFPIVCYVNGDIVFASDLSRALNQVRFDRYLMVGHRHNLDVTGELDFASGWRERLRERVRIDGVLHTPTGIDFFIFPVGCMGELPEFAVGRPGWDQWMIYQARKLRMPVIDATDEILAVHQNHDYHHIPQGRTPGTFDGPEGDRNLALVGDDGLRFTLHDATYRLGDGGTRPADMEPYLTPRLYRVSMFDKATGTVARLRRRAIYFMSARRDGAFGTPFRRLITHLAP